MFWFFRSFFLKLHLPVGCTVYTLCTQFPLCIVHTFTILNIEPFSGSMAHDIYLQMIHFCHRGWIISIFFGFWHWMYVSLSFFLSFIFLYLSISVIISIVWLSAVNALFSLLPFYLHMYPVNILYYNTFMCRWFDYNLRLS